MLHQRPKNHRPSTEIWIMNVNTVCEITEIQNNKNGYTKKLKFKSLGEIFAKIVIGKHTVRERAHHFQVFGSLEVVKMWHMGKSLWSSEKALHHGMKIVRYDSYASHRDGWESAAKCEFPTATVAAAHEICECVNEERTPKININESSHQRQHQNRWYICLIWAWLLFVRCFHAVVHCVCVCVCTRSRSMDIYCGEAYNAN